MVNYMDEIYKKYSEISNCSREYDNINQLHHYYELEMKKFKKLNNLRILEVGFGNASFINWCEKKQYEIYGYEIDEKFYNNAKKKYKNIYFGERNNIHQVIDQKFDLIVCFDVIEHVNKEDLTKFIKDLKLMLNSNGKILFRFPNGNSEAGLYYFNSDLTHYSFLNKGSLKMICDSLSLRLVSCENMARVKLFNSLKGKLFGRLSYILRDFIEIFKGYLYNNERIPLDPNLVAVVEKNELKDV